MHQQQRSEWVFPIRFLSLPTWVRARGIRFLTIAILAAFAFLSASVHLSVAEEVSWRAGAAKRDITPKESIRLSGYAVRAQSTSSVADPLAVRALAFQAGTEMPLLIISADAIGISAELTNSISEFAFREFGIDRSHTVICTTHSHTAPHLTGTLTNLYTVPQSEDEIAATNRYTLRFLEQTQGAITDALEKLSPAKITIGQTTAGFAKNRRRVQQSADGTTPVGPVDQQVRILRVTTPDDSPIAFAYQYACHCTTINPELNQVSGDWAGISASILEKQFENAIALPIIGTGADANPHPRGLYEMAQQHGKELATAITKSIPDCKEELPAPTSIGFGLTSLEYQRPDRSSLDSMLMSKTHQERVFAKTMLEYLSKSGSLPESYPAPSHLWCFGDKLAWAFLGGEVVVDYQLRLQRELHAFQYVWVAAYADDVFAYVASERVRAEGGYEVDNSMLYYNRPGRWITGTEEKWIRSVVDLQNPAPAKD